MKNLEALKKKYEEMGKEIKKLEGGDGRWKPEKDERFLYIDGKGIVQQDTNSYNAPLPPQYKIGNCFRLDQIEQLQAMVDLKEHIYKFPMPEGDYYCLYHFADYIRWKPYEYFEYIDKMFYHAGVVMHYNTTKKDRDERLRLLKLAYNID